jgi:two-component system phosphate regulon sensor histidine kinase PhoR
VERTKKLEESTERQIAQAKELARLKDEFVFIAAHELKAPITHLRWTLAEYFSSADAQEKAGPSVRNVMQVIQKASDSLTNLVTDLLSVARLESGTIKISVHPTDLVSVIQDAVLQFKGEAEKNKMRLEFRYDTSKKSPFVLGDSERLKEVFSNLIANAIKFTPEGGRVDVTVTHMGNVLEAQVKDTGIGMDKEELSKLFAKFWRANVNMEGTGLGLWLSKELVTRMGGEIFAESAKGIGSTFTVRLPVAKENGVRSEGRKA